MIRLTLMGVPPQIRRVLVNLLLSSVSVMVTVALLEVTARCFLVRHIKLADPEAFSNKPFPVLRMPNLDSPIIILAAGESSMLGEPYDPKLSIPQLLGAMLQRTNSRLAVSIRWAAGKGRGINQLHDDIIKQLDQRPSLFLFMFGHNDFLSEFPANSACAVDERLLDGLLSQSVLADYFFRRLNSRRLSEPPISSSRALLDEPIACREVLRLSEERTLVKTRSIAQHARMLGIPTVFIGPAGNQVDFAPNRSVFKGRTGVKDRFIQNMECGHHLFRIGREEEAEDRLRLALQDDDTFAAAHYWLGRSLFAQGSSAEASQHFQSAVDNDHFPYRASSQRNIATESIARAHGIPFIDAQKLARSVSGLGLDDKQLFHDVHHPSVTLYSAIANEVADNFSRMTGIEIPIHLTDEMALKMRWFNREDWVKLVFGRIQWLRRFAPYTYDEAPRIELALAMLTTASQIHKDPAIAQQQLEIESQLRTAWMEDRRRACAAGCQELRDYCNDNAVQSASPWEKSPFYREGLEVGRTWLTVAAQMPRTKLSISGVSASKTRCHLECQNGVAADGTLLQVNGSTFIEGFGLHPSIDSSFAEFQLARRFAHFSGSIGIGDTGGPLASAMCSIWGDGSLLFASPLLKFGAPQVPFRLVVDHVDVLRLECDRGGDSADFDVVSWIDPILAPRS